jgi:hypothetical protein
MREQFKNGDPFHQVWISLSKTGPQEALVVQSIVVSLGVIVSVDLKRSPACMGMASKPKNTPEDGVIVYKSNEDPLITKRFMLQNSPFVNCAVSLSK